jgi:anthranilate phosphoribosyltransferase
MKDLLEHLFEHNTLSCDEAKETLTQISKGDFNAYQISSFLTVFRMRGITVQELKGFRDALRNLCKRVDLDAYAPIDLCGTGGDGKDTFNISTLSSFVAAGAGAKVAKHGNYGVSSSCGSSNVLEHLGFQFTNDADKIEKQIDQAGICFLHAPLFHPAMKEVAPIRRNLGVRTFFNMLGPMVNPAFPKGQLVGVFSLELQRYYKYLYEESDIQYRIVHSLDGYDEISLTGDVKVISPEKEELLSPYHLSEKQLDPSAISGGNTVESSAKIFIDILEGKGTKAQNAVVVANSSMAIHSAFPSKTREQCREMAIESLQTGKAYNAFKTLLSL